MPSSPGSRAKKLENGKSTSFNVLFLQRDLTQARSAEIQALTEYNRALSQLSLKKAPPSSEMV
jgi:outer membrane protein TolC